MDCAILRTEDHWKYGGWKQGKDNCAALKLWESTYCFWQTEHTRVLFFLQSFWHKSLGLDRQWTYYSIETLKWKKRDAVETNEDIE